LVVPVVLIVGPKNLLRQKREDEDVVERVKSHAMSD
jgi:hypothetical protein